MHYVLHFYRSWGARKSKSVSWLLPLYTVEWSGYHTAVWYLHTASSCGAVSSHWVSITTNPFHSFKINGCGPFLTPEIRQPKISFFFIFLEYLQDLFALRANLSISKCNNKAKKYFDHCFSFFLWLWLWSTFRCWGLTLICLERDPPGASHCYLFMDNCHRFRQ